MVASPEELSRAHHALIVFIFILLIINKDTERVKKLRRNACFLDGTPHVPLSRVALPEVGVTCSPAFDLR